MNDKELILMVNDIQSGDINKAAHIIDMFKGFIFVNSYIDGKLSEDCMQELNIKLIDCLLKFKLTADTNILEFI